LSIQLRDSEELVGATWLIEVDALSAGATAALDWANASIARDQDERRAAM